MKLSEIYGHGKVPVSFEVSPGKDLDAVITTIKELEKFSPSLISVTYGAGGSSGKERSPELVSRILKETKTSPMPHFTCIASSKEFIEEYLKNTEKEGIENILAMRGDIPKAPSFTPGHFKYADELTSFIREKTSLSIGTAGYPEGHKEAGSLEKDTECLKRKIEAGACAVFTQLFFENSFFANYLERLSKAGIDIPVIPGILCPKSLKQLKRMTDMCGTSIPKKLENIFEKYPEGPDAEKAGIEFTVEQCRELISIGASGLHFYTLNNSNIVSQIVPNIY